MILNQKARKKLLEAIETSLETKVYDKELISIKEQLEQLEPAEENITILSTSLSSLADYIINYFGDTGVINDINKITKEEQEKIIKFINLAYEIEKHKKELWHLSQSPSFRDEKVFLNYLDDYNKRICLIHTSIKECFEKVLEG